MKRKSIAMLLVLTMAASMFAGCGSTSSKESAGSDSAASTETGKSDTASSDGSVYYLNFKPEQDQQWQDLAAAYTDETGVPVTVVTAASGTYESTLKSEMAKKMHLHYSR